MKVQIFLENDLWRSPTRPNERKHLLVFEYDDKVSASHMDALERARLITNGAIMRLNEEDLNLRLRWEKVLPGMAVSVNDDVAVNSVRYRCQPKGWKRV